MRSDSTTLPRPWMLVVAGGLVMGLALGVRHAQGIFLVPVTMDRGWSREAFGFAIALQNLVWGLAQPFTGMIADRFGARRVIAGGLALYGLGLYGMAGADSLAGFNLTAGLGIGVALSATSFGVVYGALSRLVPAEQRSWALGLAGAVGGLGQFFLVPGAQGLIDQFGWMGALAALAEAFGHRGFWLLNCGFLACGFQLAFIASHLPAYVQDKGLSAGTAVAGLATIALANVAGTYVCGLLGGLYRRKHLLCILYLLRAAAMALFVLLPLSPASLYLFCAVMGFLWLGTVPLTNGLVSQVFGVRYVTTLFGFVFFGHQLGAFLGVWLGGYVFEATRSYDLIWLSGIALGVIAAALHYPIDDRELLRPAVPALRP